jgi:hypothetical protein
MEHFPDDPEDNGHTYFIDVDGTLVHHLVQLQLDKIVDENIPYTETLLPGVRELWSKFQENDVIIITTARNEKHRKITEKIFVDNKLRFDKLIMDLPCGPRILINDTPDILWQKAVAINVRRNAGL